MKYILAIGLLATLAATPASAAGNLKCNTSSMKKVEMMMKEAMQDPKMKKQEKMAMKENEMAMKAKEAGDKKGCAMHLNMAEKELMKKS
jgi:hypothetical protein